MADINIQIKQRNGAIWDNLYPKTKAENVTESTTKRFVTDAEKSAWNGKQDALGFTPENAANKNQVNGYAGLDANGKVNANQIPAIAISDTFVVANQTAMLALTAEVGDVAVRTDLNKSFILKKEPASTLANWQELLSPSSPVQSVAGKTGAVTLVASDVGLGNVTNESKATMFTNADLTGTPTAPTAAADTNTTQIASTAFVLGQAGASTPLADGTAAVGTSKKYARDDHRHPTDTSRAPLSSPALTGTPTAPTASQGTNNTQIATTAFALAAAAERAKITVNASEPGTPSAGDFWYEVIA